MSIESDPEEELQKQKSDLISEALNVDEEELNNFKILLNMADSPELKPNEPEGDSDDLENIPLQPPNFNSDLPKSEYDRFMASTKRKEIEPANARTCQCELCKRGDRLRVIIPKLNPEDGEYIYNLCSQLLGAELDNQYWQAKEDGSWPSEEYESTTPA